MGQLKINKKCLLKIEMYNGTFTTDISETDDEAQIRDFDFIVEVQTDYESKTTSIKSIEWTDDEPPLIDVAEDYITENFFDLIQ
jgi:Zn-dependent M16 (insulinase) family peptidase